MPDLDPRLHAYRPDLAAASLEGRVEAERYVEGERAQVVRGVADLRRRPGADQPLDTQLLFGEVVTVYDEADRWAWVQNAADDYVGYVESAALDSRIHQPSHSVAVPGSFLFPAPDLKTTPFDRLSMGAQVSVMGTEGGYSNVAVGDRSGWIYSAHLVPGDDVMVDYVSTALQFLGVPYLWGGKSDLGLDCSGLVQIAMARAGIPCPRDTYVQAKELGEAVPWQAGRTVQARGDIIFFPAHVAIALDDTQVVNANAHAMMVSLEPLAELEARVQAESGGTGITVIRRPQRRGAPGA